MLFSEIYSAYFRTVAAIVTEALQGEISATHVDEIIRDRAFSESILTILPALKNSEWAVLDQDFRPLLKHKPTMPLTVLQKRWLKAVSLDPRIGLFGVPLSGLENIEPLFVPDDFVFFDRYTDGDPFTDRAYVAHFKTILTAIREKQRLHIEYCNRRNRPMHGEFTPYKLEYSAKDDKFRLETAGGHNAAYINLQRIKSCTPIGPFDEVRLSTSKRKIVSVRFTLKDERNALNRVMLHFSDCRKETRRLENDLYDVTLWYDAQDEIEILIRILSFGPMLKVTAPDHFISLIKERLSMQKTLSDRTPVMLP